MKITALNKIILNVFGNYVPNGYINIDDKDHVQINEIIKSKIKTKNGKWLCVSRSFNYWN